MKCHCRFVSYPHKIRGHLIGCGILHEESAPRTEEIDMECKHCKETIGPGEPFRAEPIAAGSRFHVAYHINCYSIVKARRQQDERTRADKAFPDYPDRHLD